MRIRHHGGGQLSSMYIKAASRCFTTHTGRGICINHVTAIHPTIVPDRGDATALGHSSITTKLRSRGPSATVPYPRLAAQYSTQSSSSTVNDVAVLGGGITGLATAHYLVKEFKNVNVTLYESKDTLGGWMKSKVMDVGNGKVIFESGPRSLRPQPPNGTLSLRLVSDSPCRIVSEHSSNVP